MTSKYNFNSEYINVDDLCEALSTTRNKLALVSLGEDVKEYIKTESLGNPYKEIEETIDWHCNPIVINENLYETCFLNRRELVQNGSIYYKSSEIKKLLNIIETSPEEEKDKFNNYLDSLFRPHIYMFYDEIIDGDISVDDLHDKISKETEGLLITGRQALKEIYGSEEINLYDVYSHWKDEFLQDEDDVRLYWKQKLCTKMNLTNPSQKIELKHVNSLQIMPYTVKENIGDTNFTANWINRWENGMVEPNYFEVDIKKIQKYFPYIQNKLDFDRLLDKNNLTIDDKEKILKLYPNSKTYIDRLINLNKIISIRQNLVNKFIELIKCFSENFNQILNFKNINNLFSWLDDWVGDPDREFGGLKRLYNYCNIFSKIFVLTNNNDEDKGFFEFYYEFYNIVSSKFIPLMRYNQHKLNIYHQFLPVNYFFPMERVIYYCLSQKDNDLNILKGYIIYSLANSLCFSNNSFNLFDVIFISLLKLKKVKKYCQNQNFITFINDIKSTLPDIEKIFYEYIINLVNTRNNAEIPLEKGKDILNILQDDALSSDEICYKIENLTKNLAENFKKPDSGLRGIKLIDPKKNFTDLIKNIESCYQFIIKNSDEILDLINTLKNYDLMTDITDKLQNSKEYKEYKKEIFDKYNNFSPADLPLDMFSYSPLYPITMEELLDPKDLFMTIAKIHKIPFHKKSTKERLLRRVEIDDKKLKDKIYYHIQYDNYYNDKFVFNNLFYSPQYKKYLMGSMFETTDKEKSWHDEYDSPELNQFQKFLDKYKKMTTQSIP